MASFSPSISRKRDPFMGMTRLMGAADAASRGLWSSFALRVWEEHDGDIHGGFEWLSSKPETLEPEETVPQVAYHSHMRQSSVPKV
jgi:hypothetical protein